MTLAAGDRRIQVSLLIVYGEQNNALLDALRDYAGSCDYISFLERILSINDIHPFRLKSYHYYWKGLRKHDVSQRVEAGQGIQLFKVPTVFERQLSLNRLAGSISSRQLGWSSVPTYRLLNLQLFINVGCP